MLIRKNKGFTLIELVMVVAIIVILLSILLITIPSIINAVNVRTAKTQIKMIVAAAEMYKLRYGVYPYDYDNLDSLPGNGYSTKTGQMAEDLALGPKSLLDGYKDARTLEIANANMSVTYALTSAVKGEKPCLELAAFNTKILGKFVSPKNAPDGQTARLLLDPWGQPYVFDENYRWNRSQEFYADIPTGNLPPPGVDPTPLDWTPTPDPTAPKPLPTTPPPTQTPVQVTISPTATTPPTVPTTGTMPTAPPTTLQPTPTPTPTPSPTATPTPAPCNPCRKGIGQICKPATECGCGWWESDYFGLVPPGEPSKTKEELDAMNICGVACLSDTMCGDETGGGFCSMPGGMGLLSGCNDGQGYEDLPQPGGGAGATVTAFDRPDPVDYVGRFFTRGKFTNSRRMHVDFDVWSFGPNRKADAGNNGLDDNLNKKIDEPSELTDDICSWN